ncbi:MAG TPA: phage holin family protein [Candidatus Phocaeicola excrementigallinarum]|nr:phage holin family protein [Candidatus Phocaeicola excrementigallinarum]
MFANENSINNLESLVKEIKKYIGLQGEYLRLDVVEKLTVLLSTLILILVLTILGMMALFYFSFMLVYALVPIVGSIIGSYAIIGGVILLLALLVYRMRKQWIFQPIVNFLARLFLEDSADKHKQ